MTISFEVSREDVDLITKIVSRAAKIYEEVYGEELDRLDITMDLTACIANGCPLKLQQLLDADDFNFTHDVFGISNHIDRTTGKLTRCFLPRFAKL